MIRFKETSTPPTLFILDTTGKNQDHIRNQLVNYKKRWNESLADDLAIISNIHEATAGSTILVPQYILNSLPDTKPVARYKTMASVNAMTHYDLRAAIINPIVTFTDKPEQALEWLNATPDTITLDFETTGLAHPSQEIITHLAVGTSESEAFVIIFSDGMEAPVMDWLVTTKKKQIWHNLSFDGKYMIHRTGKFPKNYEDSQLLAWSYLNHADTYRAKVGLKGLAGKIYGEWAVAKDLFGLEHMYNPEMITYAGTDTCATFFVWNEYTFGYKSERVVK